MGLMNRLPHILQKGLRPFADVRPGEAAGALLLAADLFCLMASYYVLKTVREALVLSEGGAEVKSYAAAAQAVILLAAIPLYGLVASRVNRGRLVDGVMLFFTSHLILFVVLSNHGARIGVPFFLWVGVFNLMIVAQFWAFANDLYTVERGERLFPLLGAGGSVGALFGARAASSLMTARARPADLLLIAAAGLLVCVALNQVARRGAFDRANSGSPRDRRPLASSRGFQLIAKDRYLMLLAILMVLVNVVNTTGEYVLGRLVVAHAAGMIAAGTAHGLTKAQLIGAWYGDFFGWVNLVSLTIQLLLVSRIFKWTGVGGALFALPLIAFGSYAMLAWVPIIGAVRIAKILENSTDYSLQNTARHAMYLPTSPEAKFTAKQVIDAFCCRLGDVLQAAVVYAGAHLAFGVREFALVNEALVLVWIAVAIALYGAHQRLLATAGPAHRAARESNAEPIRLGSSRLATDSVGLAGL